MDESVAWIQERIHDKKHFSARFLTHVSQVSGMKSELLACFLGGLLLILLVFSEQAHFFANSILVGVPLLLLFVYPDEKPKNESFFFYFSAFGAVTVLDRTLETIPCFYVLKLTFFLLLHLPPYSLKLRIEQVLLKSVEGSSVQKSESSRRSPLEKRASSTKTAIAGTMSPMTEDSTQRTSPFKSPSNDVTVTVTEEYYREEELLSPNGTIIDRRVTGPFRREVVRTENKKRINS